MKRSGAMLLLAIAASGVLVGLMSIGVATAFAASHHALFIQTDDPAANQIVVYDRHFNGTLTLAATYATGGKGGVAAGAVVDPLASQGSLVTAFDRRVLLCVNAGSDTVSVFRIVRGDRLRLTQQIASGGSFPISIAVHGSLVYVLNAGGAGALRGYRLSGAHLRPIVGSDRSLGLANTNPPNFLASPGQVGFSRDGRRLIVTTKGSGSDLLVFRVGPVGRLSAQPKVNASATPSPFAFTFDAKGRLVVIEAGMSTLSSYMIKADNTLTTLGSAADGQAAGCWVTRARGHFYVSNAGSATVSSFTLNTSGQPVLVGIAASTEAGTIDSIATPNRHFLYVECGGAGTVDVFRIGMDGSLTPVQTVTALPIPFEGIAID
jgi:Lactonase, 7-bladed beta-propeller